MDNLIEEKEIPVSASAVNKLGATDQGSQEKPAVVPVPSESDRLKNGMDCIYLLISRIYCWGRDSICFGTGLFAFCFSLSKSIFEQLNYFSGKALCSLLGFI